MSSTTDIEKKNLEAHVELCAERYNALETRIDNVDEKISTLSLMVEKVHGMLQKMSTKRNDQLITWGAGLIGVLLSIIGWLISHYAVK